MSEFVWVVRDAESEYNDIQDICVSEKAAMQSMEELKKDFGDVFYVEKHKLRQEE